MKAIKMVMGLTLVLAVLFSVAVGQAAPLSMAIDRPMPPNEVKIGRAIYKIKFIAGDGAFEYGLTCDANAVRKQACNELDTIYLVEGQTINDERDTLIHEIQHGILGTERSRKKIRVHKLIYELSAGLLRVFQDNPALWAYWTVPVPAER
jgi:hypothetical protein